MPPRQTWCSRQPPAPPLPYSYECHNTRRCHNCWARRLLARGEIVAITDMHCMVDERWVAAILTAQSASSPVVGGVVEPGRLRTLVDWAAYFYDYGRFMLPLPAGVSRLVPGINISLKRSALARGRTFVEPEFWKSYWCRQLQTEGSTLVVDPAIIVFYHRSFRFRPFLVRWFHQGRCFAGMRLTQFSSRQRLFHAVGSVALPLVFCWRIIRDVLPKRRYRGKLCLSLPIIVCAAISWALGECVGYCVGAGTSCRHVR